jgi:hypothetical protein
MYLHSNLPPHRAEFVNESNGRQMVDLALEERLSKMRDLPPSLISTK